MAGPASALARPAPVERRLGRALRTLRDRQLHIELGWARLGDYAAECLGFSLRTVQDLVRTEEAIAALPLTAAAFDAGQVSAVHVRALSRIATVENEKLWLARARRMDVRSLRRAVAAALSREELAGNPDGSFPRSASLRRGEGSPDPGLGQTSAVDPPGRQQVAPVRRHQKDEDDEPELKLLSVSAPVWVIGWWRDAMTLARRLAGSALPQGAALEVVLSESQDVVGGMKERTLPGVKSRGEESVSTTLAGARACRDQDPSPIAAGTGASAELSNSCPPAPSPHACALDAELKSLVTERQRLEASLAERLGMDRAAGAHLLDGGGSFERYASRRYGISPRRIYYLLSLQRTLERLSALKRAYVSGRLTLRQTILVGKVASRRTASAWIRRAERITLRRLEDEVEYWELLRVERPEVWDRLRGHPLPDGIVLVPGHAPRLHAFACRRSAGGDERCDSQRTPGQGCLASPEGNGDRANETRTDLHAFARPEPLLGWLTDTDDDSPIDAWSFIEALSASVAATPLPARMGVLRMRVEAEVREMWHDTVTCFRALSEEPLEEWEVLVLTLRRFFQVWDNKETRRQRREHPILERDGWRCAFPGCRSVGTGKLQTHHVLFRSHGGTDDDPGLLVALCNAHHLFLLHQGYIRCSGSAPDDLVWELGTGGNLPAWRIYRGDVLVGGRALMPTAAAMGTAM